MTRTHGSSTCGAAGCTAAAPSGASLPRNGRLPGHRAFFARVPRRPVRDRRWRRRGARLHHLQGLSGDGKELRSMDNRITWVLRKNRDGAWKIIHEHTSAPADFDTGRVTL